MGRTTDCERRHLIKSIPRVYVMGVGRYKHNIYNITRKTDIEVRPKVRKSAHELPPNYFEHDQQPHILGLFNQPNDRKRKVWE